MQTVLSNFCDARLLLLYDDSIECGRSILVAPARGVTPELMNRMIELSNGGITFVAISPQRAQGFILDEMSRPRVSSVKCSSHELTVCVSVEARSGVSTGISAADRAVTVNILAEDPPNPRALVKPGHIFPVVVREGGVLVRHSLPEGALDIVRLAEQGEAALYFDMLDEHGEFLQPSRALNLAEQAGISSLSLSELTRHRLENENLISKIAEARLPTRIAGELRSCIYRSALHGGEHLALIKGEIDPAQPVLTRVQPEFTFADVFGGQSPPTRTQLHGSLRAIAERGSGVLLYLRRPEAGQLRGQVAAWRDQYMHKPAEMMREYGVGAQILRDLGVRRIELLSGSRKRLSGLTTFGIEIVSQTPIPGLPNGVSL